MIVGFIGREVVVCSGGRGMFSLFGVSVFIRIRFVCGFFLC